MRGIFAAGVLDLLLEKEICFDHVIGVSAGACHGCSFVCGQKGRAYATATDYLDRKEYCSLQSLRKTGDLFGAQFIYHTIPEKLYPIDNDAYKESGILFQAAVTNCRTGEAEYPVIRDMFDDVEYIRASSSLPFLANMVEIDGQLYMDGGIADSIPVEQALRQGDDKVVAVLTRPRDYRKKPSCLAPLLKLKYGKYPHLIEALTLRAQRYNETLERIKEEEAAGRVFVIAPMGPLDIGRTEKDPEKLRRGYQEGYFVAEGLQDKLIDFLRA